MQKICKVNDDCSPAVGLDFQARFAFLMASVVFAAFIMDNTAIFALVNFWPAVLVPLIVVSTFVVSLAAVVIVALVALL